MCQLHCYEKTVVKKKIQTVNQVVLFEHRIIITIEQQSVKKKN